MNETILILFSIIFITTLLGCLLVVSVLYLHHLPIKMRSFGLSLFLLFGVTGGLYYHYGAIGPVVDFQSSEEIYLALKEIRDQDTVSIDSVTKRLSKLEQKLPKTHFAWSKLGDVYLNVKFYDDALRAFEKAEKYGEGESVYHAKTQQAYALSLMHWGHLDEKAQQLINDVLAEYPTHRGALNLLAMDAFQQGAYLKAFDTWSQMIHLEGLSSQEKMAIVKVMRKAKSQLSETELLTRHCLPKPITVKVSLSNAFQPQLTDEVMLFVYAKQAPDQPPVAAMRLPVKQFPVTVELDELNAMQQGHQLAVGMPVTFGARISRSGDALPQKGDLQGKSAQLVVQSAPENIEIVINEPYV